MPVVPVQKPSRWRAAAGSAVTSMPSTVTRPAVGTRLVARMRSVVVLPAPLGPSRPKMRPGAHVKLIPSTARNSPPRFGS